MSVYSTSMTYEAIMKSLLSRVPNTVDKREGSVIYDALAPVAAQLAQTYMELDVIMDETFVDTASMQYLIRRCNERGVPVHDATYATIKAEFTPAALELVSGLRFNCEKQNYIITEKVSDGVYKLKAETAGAAGNIYSGLLLPIQYVDGLQTAQITEVLIPGEDADDTDALRKRYFDSLNGTAFGGNIADYKEKVNALDGVGGVKVYPVWNGGGTVKLTIIASDYTVPSAELIDSVQTAVDPTQNSGEGMGLAPIGHVVTVVGVDAASVNVATKIQFVDGWSFETAQSTLETAIHDYFSELASTWDDETATIVRISQIENRLLNLSCVLDIEDTTLNGLAKNLQLDGDSIPTLGALEVTG